MRILGIDPGIKNLGWAIVEGHKRKLEHIESGIFNPETENLHEKLYEIYNFVRDLIIQYDPHFIAIESVFVSKNPRNTLRLGEVRAACMIASASCDKNTFDFAPRKAKQMITGNGNAKKEVVADMVCRILSIERGKTKLDRYDAIALAICGIWEIERKI